MVVSLLTSRAWLAGFALMLAGLGCQTVVLTFEPVSIVQPVLASGVAVVLVLSRLVLRERLGGAETWGVAAIAVLRGPAGPVRRRDQRGGRPSRQPGLDGGGHDPVGGRGRAGRGPARCAAGAASTASRPAGSATASAPACSTASRPWPSRPCPGILVSHHTPASIVTGLISSPYLYVLAGCLAAAMLLFQAALQACRASIVVPVSSVAEQRVLHGRRDLAVPRAPAGQPGPARPAPGRDRAGRAGARHAVPAGAGTRLPARPARRRRRTQLSGRREETVMALDQALLDILVCPIDKRGLLYFADDAVLYNPRLRRLYRIENGIPLMLARQAVPVPEEEHSRLMKCARRGEVTTITAGQDDVLAGGELARQPVHGQPGLVDQHDGAGQPGRRPLARRVRVVDDEPYPGRAQYPGQRPAAADDAVEPPRARVIGRQFDRRPPWSRRSRSPGATAAWTTDRSTASPWFQDGVR